MIFHHERFAPDREVPEYERSSLEDAEKLQAGPYYDWTEIPWAWIVASPPERSELLNLYNARVHVNDPKVIYTVELPPQTSFESSRSGEA